MKYPTADLCSAGDQIYGSVHARRAPYPLSYTSTPLLVSLSINNKAQKWYFNYPRTARSLGGIASQSTHLACTM